MSLIRARISCVAALLVFTAVEAPAAAALARFAPCWVSGDTLVVWEHGKPNVIARLPVNVVVIAGSQAGHIAIATQTDLFVLPAGTRTPVSIRRKVRKGSNTLIAGVAFAGASLSVTLSNPDIPSHNPDDDLRLSVPLPKRLASEALDVREPASSTGADSPTGRYRWTKAVTRIGEGQRIDFERVDASGTNGMRLVGLDVCTSASTDDCTGTVWDVGVGWLSGDLLWARATWSAEGERAGYWVLSATDDKLRISVDPEHLDRPIVNT